MANAIIPQELTQTRASIYLLFARLFREAPTPELFREIVQHRWLSNAEHFHENGLQSRAWDIDLAEDPQWPNQAEEIAVDYARLFAVPGERAVRPYESVYCDTLVVDTSTACSAYFPACAAPSNDSGAVGREPEPPRGGLRGFLHGSSVSAVREAYRRAGFELDPATHELPDHLAVELEFIGRLLEHGELEQATAFFTEHLGRWGLRCLGEIRQKASASFYRTLADTLAAFLRREQQLYA